MNKETLQKRILAIVIHYRSSGTLPEMLSCVSWMNGNNIVGLIIARYGSRPEELANFRLAVAGFSNSHVLESAASRGHFGGRRFVRNHYLEHGNALPGRVIDCNYNVLIEDKEDSPKLLCQDPRAAGVITQRIQALPGRVGQTKSSMPSLSERLTQERNLGATPCPMH